MTPSDLQDALAAELERIFSGHRLPTSSGSLRELRVYRQDAPVPTANDEDFGDEAQLVPYSIVRITDGTFSDWSQALHVGVVVIFCVYDAAEDRQGTKDILHLITATFHRFAENPNLGNFTCEVPIDWAIQSETETYPYYYGAMQLKFTCPGVCIVDPLA